MAQSGTSFQLTAGSPPQRLLGLLLSSAALWNSVILTSSNGTNGELWTSSSFPSHLSNDMLLLSSELVWLPGVPSMERE